jgi:hypothetical protein
MWKLLVGFICIFFLPVHAEHRDNFSAWFVDFLVRVFPDTPHATSKFELALVSARNGHINLQVAMRSESHQLVRVRVIAPRLGMRKLRFRFTE